MTSTLVVIQARTGSTRLPGKVLADVGGMPMLAFQLRRLLPMARREGWTVVVATSDLPGDDPVADLGGDEGVAVVRGSEADVLRRFAQAADAFPTDTVVRLTGDCPLTDPAVVAAVVALHRSTGADYTSNVLPRSFPKGLDVEAMSSTALRAADAAATAAADREHVTPYLYRHPERFRLANHSSGRDLGEEWWTVDSAPDLERVREIVGFVATPLTATWTEFLQVAGVRNGAPDGRVRLAPNPGPEPGSAPWRRSWTAVVDGTAVGQVSVSVTAGVGERSLDVAPEWRAAASTALDELLDGDQQVRPIEAAN